MIPPLRRPVASARALAVALALHAAVASADEPVPVRVGDHPGFGRVVFDLGHPVPYRMTRDGDRVVLRFDGAGAVGVPARYPRNVVGFSAGASQAEILVRAGARVRPLRVASGLAIDVWDPPPGKPPAAASPSAPALAAQQPGARAATEARPVVEADTRPAPPRGSSATPYDAAGERSAKSRRAEPARVGPATPEPTSGGAVMGRTGEPAPSAATSAAATSAATAPMAALPPAAAPTAGGGPGAIPVAPASPLALVATVDQDGMLRLPFAGTTGAAAFRRGSFALLVFDERRPVDLSGLKADPVFAAATVQLLPEATVVRLPLRPTASLLLGRGDGGWRVVVQPAPTHPAAIAATVTDRRLVLAAAASGRVLNVADPETGGVLLVGTQRQPGQGVPVARRTPEFVLLPTWQGVAVEPLSDRLFLRNGQDGFVLGAEPTGLALAPPPIDTAAYADAGSMTRRFDFPPFAPDSLQRQLQAAVDAAAAAPPLARASARRHAAEAMIALGLGVEAQSVLRLAIAEDGREADNPDSSGLSAIAALLAGRTGETDAILDPRLDGTDEITLWRAVRDAKLEEGSAAAAPAFAATLPLLLAYPPSLRDRLLPLAAETMALAGSTAADTLLARFPDDPRLALARAFRLAGKGDRDGALALFDRTADGADRLARLRAATAAVELRLASGALGAGAAADALEKQIDAWRGDGREIALRLRIAELRSRAGAWRPALALLRETETLDAGARPKVHDRLLATFAALLTEGNLDRMPALDLVTLLDENADLLPADGEAATALAERLADRLLALDLPRRADAVFGKLVAGSAGTARASFGARLAALRLREGDAAGALAALADTDLDGLPTPLQQRRAMTRAGALARRGDPAGATRVLADIDTDAAAALRASILEEAHDWPAAAQALAAYAARTVPPAGALDDMQRRTLLRLAAATAQAGDAASVAALRQREGKRMEGGPLGDMFRLLTAGPVAGGSDLPRAASEMALARNLPADLKAMDPPRPPP